MFLRSEEVCSFERETCIHSFGGRLFLRTRDIYPPNRCACPTRIGVQVPLGRVGRCQASVLMPPERPGRSDPSGSATLIRAQYTPAPN